MNADLAEAIEQFLEVLDIDEDAPISTLLEALGGDEGDEDGGKQ